MRLTFTRTQAALACTLALGAFSANVGAQQVVNEHMIVTSSSGEPVMSGFGECVHSGFSSPARAETATHDVTVAFDNGSTRDVRTDYRLHDGDRVTTLPDGKVLGFEAAPLSSAGCYPAVALAPAPVHAEKVIPPAPVVIAAAAPAAVYEKVVFDVDVLFDSNKYNLLPAGRDQLDSFVGKIGGLEARSMLAVGYADRMGTDASNQTLSENRVNTVKAYLVSQGVASNRVDTSARGEREPTTWAAECKDANSPKNVACMQPDRHVFIEISGSRLAQ
ncbi:MAG TPA: OmpA family protein [Steroidobacteraceae bacterium]|nr:OmpA family protein [Steroidobacteraceae bacterium]